LVAFATETVYGLGARADDDAAVAKIYAAKGRPADHPLIVHVVNAAQATEFAASLPGVAQRLMAAFWPGPLTLIVPRRPDRAEAAAAGQSTIGLRCPAHPVAQSLLRAAAQRGVAGVAAPSANRFGRVSPTSAAHVRSEFGLELTVLDGGDCDIGIESCIVDCSRGYPVLLRPGALTVAQIEAAAGERLQAADAGSPRASGTLAAHYAPRARVHLLTSAQWCDPSQWRLLQLGIIGARIGEMGDGKVAVYSRQEAPSAPADWLRQRMPKDALAVAHELFAALRAFDAMGVTKVVVELPPDEPEWQGVRDRLMRAAASL
jgi:L-threonylcarbamoyladenylate synthase